MISILKQFNIKNSSERGIYLHYMLHDLTQIFDNFVGHNILLHCHKVNKQGNVTFNMPLASLVKILYSLQVVKTFSLQSQPTMLGTQFSLGPYGRVEILLHLGNHLNTPLGPKNLLNLHLAMVWPFIQQ